MDDLIDELSGATLDGDGILRDVPMKSKNNKPVNRTASIINRSKLLNISDSESGDDEDTFTRRRISKSLRISRSTRNPWKSRDYSQSVSKYKRKRNSTSEVATSNSNIFTSGGSNSQQGGKFAIRPCKTEGWQTMEVECDTSSSELSDHECSSCETNFDGDDEQSDFYDSASAKTPPCFRNRVYCHSRPKTEFKMPAKPANPFFVVGESSSSFCKRRRPMY